MFYFVGFLMLLAAVTGVTGAAFRAEHLVLLHWEKAGFFLLEHVHGGRYEKIPLVAAPRAVWRFTARRATAAWLTARRRARDWAHAHRPHALGAKV